MKKNIEAEGGELILKDENGTIAIIPKDQRQEALGYLKDNCSDCLNNLISSLPVYGDKAGEGMLISELYTQKTGKDWSTAKSEGLTTGSYSDNIKLRDRLLNNEFKETPTNNINTNQSYADAKTFNEAFKIARQQLGANNIFEYQGRKYGTNLAGEEFNPSEEVLSKYNSNTPEIKNRLYQQNQSVKSPYTSKNTVKLEPEYKSWDDLKQQQLELNKASQADRIVTFKQKDKSGKNYVIVDKKKGLVHIYEPGKTEPTYTSAIDLGKNPSDAQTTTKYKDINNDGRITNDDKVKGKFKVDWDAGNMATGAGRYYISNIDKKGYGGQPILNMMNEAQYTEFKKTGKVENVATSFHKGYIKDDNFRVSNGCIRCNKPTLDKLSNYLTNDSEVYILPEDEDNEFVIENDKLNFKIKSKKNYDTYIDSKGRLQKGQGGNRTTNTLNYKPIKVELKEDLFKKNVYQTFDLNDDDELNNNTKPFIKSLVDNKQSIMKIAKINGDVYNDIVKVAFGIYGTESNFGDTHSAIGNLGRAVRKAISPSSSSSPDYKSKATTYGANKDSNSVGLTQLRFSMLDANEKKMLKEAGITKPSELLNPEKAAIATMIILGSRYNTQMTSAQKKDIMTYLPKKWNIRKNYTDRVKYNSQYINIKQLD